jgi:hypothetical protein
MVSLEARLPQVRVTPELKAALEERARQKNIRLNDAIRQAVVDYVEKVRVPIIGVIRPGPDGEPVIVLNEENQE